MWYDKMVIKVLFVIAKILANRSDKISAYEIGKLEKEFFEIEIGD